MVGVVDDGHGGVEKKIDDDGDCSVGRLQRHASTCKMLSRCFQRRAKKKERRCRSGPSPEGDHEKLTSCRRTSSLVRIIEQSSTSPAHYDTDADDSSITISIMLLVFRSNANKLVIYFIDLEYNRRIESCNGHNRGDYNFS